MPYTPSYYPATIDGRAHWWQVIFDNASTVLTPLGFTPAQIAAIVADAAWAIYCYGTIHRFYQSVSDSLTLFEREILDAPDGAAMPKAINVDPLPDPPTVTILAGVEARRIKWAQEVKNKPGATPSVLAQLGLGTPANPFNPVTYNCLLFALASRTPGTVSGKFRKAGGHVDGINLYGRKSGTAAWTLLGRFNATPFTASVPVSGTAPEEWNFTGWR